MSQSPEMMTEPGLRELVLRELRHAPEPMRANRLKKQLRRSADGERELLDAEIEALIATGELYIWSQTAKERTVWIHAPGAYFHDKLMEILSDRPLTENETLRSLAAIPSAPALPKEAIKQYLASLVEEGQIFRVGTKYLSRDPSARICEGIRQVMKEQPRQPQSAAAIAKQVTQRTRIPTSSKGIAPELAILVDDGKIFKLKSSYLGEDPAELAETTITKILANQPDRVFSKRELAQELKIATPLSLVGKDLEGVLDKLIETGKAFAHGKDKYGAREAPLPLDRKLLRALESQRQEGGAAYPTSLRHLAESCARPLEDPQLRELLTKKSSSFRKNTELGSCEVDPETLVVLKGDQSTLTDSCAFLERVLSKELSTGSLRAIEELVKSVPAPLRPGFRDSLVRRLAEERMPAGIAWIGTEDKLRIFRVEDLFPSSLRPQSKPSTVSTDSIRAKPARPFEPAFTAAFERLDQEGGSNNLVSLADLRRELHEFSREEFDLGIWSLRHAGRFSLRPADGRYGIAQEERDAGFVEGGILLVNVSRRSS